MKKFLGITIIAFLGYLLHHLHKALLKKQRTVLKQEQKKHGMEPRREQKQSVTKLPK